MTVAECRPLLEDSIMDKRLSKDLIISKAVSAVENNGIVFIDEIDKICVRPDAYRTGAEASSEGVQRDLLPLIEGTTVNTKYGNVDTTRILFIASGAFHDVKPADLLPELQGRLPIRVQLSALSEKDLFKILTETKFNQIDQAEALMKADNVTLKFDMKAIKLIAKYTRFVNESLEDIGARRLHTVIEKILEEVSFKVPSGTVYVIDEAIVKKNLGDMLAKKRDLTKYVL